ncbi:2522_t:CDS:1, partial [Paraglomus occultum]
MWRRYCKNYEFPSWWHSFKQEWNTAKEKVVYDTDQYHTDIETWVCSCPAYLNNPYLICKHLVAMKIRLNPGFTLLFKDIMQCHDYPFINFYQEHNSRIQVDNTPWNYVQENDNQFVDEPLDVANMNTLDVSTTYQQSSIRERQEVLTRLKSLVIHGFDLAEENIQND